MNDEEGAQIAALLREHSLWITQEYERGRVAGELYHNFLIRKFSEEKQMDEQAAKHVIYVYWELRNLHFARRKNYCKRGGLHLEMIAGWTPPGWVCSLFPMPAPDMEMVTLDYVVDALHGEIDLCTEWDSVPLGRVLHVAHMLVSHQEADGLWPAVLDLRTGYGVGTQRSSAPRNLMRRLNAVLLSSEFDLAIGRIEAGISAQNAK